jgi:outer membrane protein assembly factor BamE
MQKLLISLLLFASLLSGGCSTDKIPGVYRPDIQQGNVVTQGMVDKLRPGMTRQQVAYIMGTPLLVDVFHQNRWDYLYSMEPGDEDRQQERISIYFEEGRLARIEGDFRPMPVADPMTQDKETVHRVPDYGERKKGFFKRTMETVGFGSDDGPVAPPADSSDEATTAESDQPQAEIPTAEPVEQETGDVEEEAAEEADAEEQGFFGSMWDVITFSSDEEE